VWGVWNANGVLKVAREATLPPRCIRCGRATSFRLEYKAFWHPRGYYFFLLLGLWPYMLVYFLVRRPFPLSVPLCMDHERARRNRVGVAGALAAGGFVLMAVAMSVSNLLFLSPIGFIAFAVGCFMALPAVRILKPVEIDAQTLYARGVSPEFLGRLPIAAG
jgi:hypothetical protein